MKSHREQMINAEKIITQKRTQKVLFSCVNKAKKEKAETGIFSQRKEWRWPQEDLHDANIFILVFLTKITDNIDKIFNQFDENAIMDV